MKLYNIFLSALCAGALCIAQAGVAEAATNTLDYSKGVDSTGYKVGDKSINKTASGYHQGTSYNNGSYHFWGEPTYNSLGHAQYNTWFPGPGAVQSASSGMPIGTVISMPREWSKSDAAGRGYLPCYASMQNGSLVTPTFKASDYPELARKLQVCVNCGNPLRQTASKTTSGGHTVYGYSATDTANVLNPGQMYCTVCNKDVSWKYCYNDSGAQQDSNNIKLPDLRGKFLRGYNRGTGFNKTSGVAVRDSSTGGSYVSTYNAMAESEYRRNAHYSAQMDQTQEASALGTAPTQNGQTSTVQFPIGVPLKDTSSGSTKARFDDIASNDFGNVAVTTGKVEQLVSEDMTKVGKVFNAISNPLSLISGVWDKSKTYNIGTPIRYELNADIGNPNDGTGDVARPVNMAVFYYVKAK